jgi:hypothetical protein
MATYTQIRQAIRQAITESRLSCTDGEWSFSYFVKSPIRMSDDCWYSVMGMTRNECQSYAIEWRTARVCELAGITLASYWTRGDGNWQQHIIAYAVNN